MSDRNAPQKHVWRAKIILATADGCGTSEIMRRSGKAKPVVWRWQARFMAEGVEGLTRDKTRKPGKPPLPAATGAAGGRFGALCVAGRSQPLDARRGRRPGSAFRLACSYQVDGAICRILHTGSTPNSRMWASMKPITS